MAQYAHLSIPDPEWAAVTPHLPPAKPIVSIQAYRDEVAAIKGKFRALADKGATEGLKVIEKLIEVENGEIRVRAYVPDPQGNEIGGFPLMVWMFGGGFALGSIDDDDALLRNLAVNSRIVCVAGDYRKAPEHPFPAAVNDSYASMKWALNSASELSIDTSKGVVVAGASAGGNIATVLAHRSLKDPVLKGIITGQLLVMPSVISPEAYPEKFKSELLSVDKDEDKYVLTKSHFFTLYNAYHGDLHAANPEVSPLLTESFEGLPATYIQISGLDIVRDEAFLYERLLKEAGVATRVDVYPGLPHGFHLSLKGSKSAEKQKKDFINGLDWLLGRND